MFNNSERRPEAKTSEFSGSDVIPTKVKIMLPLVAFAFLLVLWRKSLL